jgi:hypothetical protein
MQARALTAAGLTLWLCAIVPAATAADAKPQPAADGSPAPADDKAAAGSKGVKPAGPRLQMGKNHPAKNPGKDRDMRHCLDLPDTKEVIRCYEKK